ncbi:MAG: phosphatidate cytidylyltransferase [Lachnospiraceae bacterium]|nr:phosphatidate cytidylyltransferase [Lachnospiraceae bacterium]
MFKIRLLSSIVLVVIALATILGGGWYLAGILWAISLVAYRELCQACKIREGEQKTNSLEMLGFVFITLYYLAMAGLKNPLYMILVVLMALVGFLFVYVFSFPKIHARQVMSAYFSFVYAPVMFSFVYLTRELEYGIYFVWMIFVSSWISDTFAYIFGMLFGKHSLAPILSPKKSIEGSVAGIIGSALCGGLFGYFLVERLIHGQEITFVFALIGGIGSVISQIGDLAASAIKRNYEIKDYGKLIPGHGGIMDRFDSVIVTAPMIYFLFRILITAVR